MDADIEVLDECIKALGKSSPGMLLVNLAYLVDRYAGSGAASPLWLLARIERRKELTQAEPRPSVGEQ